MLTDKDKCDLYHYIWDRLREVESDCTRLELTTTSARKILRFLIDHPDICAAEISDFLDMEIKDFDRDFDRLHQQGMLDDF